MGATVNVTTTASDVLPYAERQGWLIENKSDAAIQLIWDGTDVTASTGANPGMTLNPSQRISATTGARDKGTPWNKVSAIHSSTGNKQLSVFSW